MKRFRIKPNVDPKVLYNFGFKYKGNWARGELYQKEVPELKGLGDGISINFDVGAEIHFIFPYMDIKYPNIENYIQDLIKAGYVEEFGNDTKEELLKVLGKIEGTISYNNLDKYDISDPWREVEDVDGVVDRLLLARDTLKKVIEDMK